MLATDASAASTILIADCAPLAEVMSIELTNCWVEPTAVFAATFSMLPAELATLELTENELLESKVTVPLTIMLSFEAVPEVNVSGSVEIELEPTTRVVPAVEWV